jgi:hypothetical protein
MKHLQNIKRGKMKKLVAELKEWLRTAPEEEIQKEMDEIDKVMDRVEANDSTIDNFGLIRPLLQFNDPDVYYHLQILVRGKDNTDSSAKNRLIKTYYICKLESLDFIEDEVKRLCQFFSARAYINLAPKSLRKTALMQIKNITERLYDNDLKKIWKTFDSAAGIVKSDFPHWIIDVDEDMKEKEEEIREFIEQSKPLDIKEKIYCKIPTVHGFHFITMPFDLYSFKKEYPKIDVHRNNPTLLYYQPEINVFL